jgi:hypothetical protein
MTFSLISTFSGGTEDDLPHPNKEITINSRPFIITNIKLFNTKQAIHH